MLLLSDLFHFNHPVFIGYIAVGTGSIYGAAVGTALVYSGRVKLESYDNAHLLEILGVNLRETLSTPAVAVPPVELIEFACPDCDQLMRVTEAQLGGRVQCHQCGLPIQLEAE